MILTVADLSQAIAGLPLAMPVRIECAVWDSEDDAEPSIDTAYAAGIEFQGNHILITCAQ